MPISFILFSDDHAVTIGYNNKNSTWTVVGSNSYLSKGIDILSPVCSKKELIKLLHNEFTNYGFVLNDCDYNNIISLFVKIFIAHKVDQSIQPIIDYFHTKLDQNIEWKDLHTITPNKINEFCYIGVSWLYTSSLNNDTEMVQKLISAKVDVDLTYNNYETALWIASNHGHTSTVKLLINANANLDATDDDEGSTALWTAAENGYTKIVKLLIDIMVQQLYI